MPLSKTLRMVLLSLGMGQGVQSMTFQMAGNPLVKHVSSADPSCHNWDGTVWCYTSKDGNLLEHGREKTSEWTYEFMEGFHVFSSTDMINWVDHGEIFNSDDCPWGGYGWMWAPGAARMNGKYYLYYPKKDWNLQWRVGIAVADRPQGPFTDIGKPLDGMSGIDPMVFFDDDGEAYLYLNDYQVSKLKPNMVELAEEPHIIDYAPDWVKSDHDKKFEEGSFVFKHNGKYYFTYSNWQENGPTAYYGIGDSPYGPFDWKGELSGPTRGAPDHHSIINFRGEYYYFYHMDTDWEDKNDIEWHGHRRLACYDRMYIDPDNTIQVVQRTYGEPIYVPDGGSSNPCDSNPCSSGSTCVNRGDGTHVCKYADPCEENPCTQAGTFCINKGEGEYRCKYDDPCDANPCDNFSTCVDFGNGKHECQPHDLCEGECKDWESCLSVESGEHVCEYVSPCDENPCQQDRFCIDKGKGNFACRRSATPDEEAHDEEESTSVWDAIDDFFQLFIDAILCFFAGC